MIKIGFYILAIIASVFGAFAQSSIADDNLYPAGYDFISDYLTDTQNKSVNDTILIDKYFVNNQPFTVTGLYFSDHLPDPELLSITTAYVRLNGNNIDYLLKQENTGTVIDNYASYYWIIDSPESSDNQKLTLIPGDSLHIQVKAVPRLMGAYTFPMHTVVFQSNGGSFFTIADEISFNVSYLCGDADGNGYVNVLDITRIINYLYYGGTAPVPYESGDLDSSGSINILDITYLILYLYGEGKDPICE